MASKSILKNKRKTIKDPAKEQGIWIFPDTECRWIKRLSSHGIHYFKHSKIESFKFY